MVLVDADVVVWFLTTTAVELEVFVGWDEFELDDAVSLDNDVLFETEDEVEF